MATCVAFMLQGIAALESVEVESFPLQKHDHAHAVGGFELHKLVTIAERQPPGVRIQLADVENVRDVDRERWRGHRSDLIMKLNDLGA